MKGNLAIRQLLAILVVAGLVLAPLARPVMAAAAPDAAMADEMSMMAADDAMAEDIMAEDMACCPSKAPAAVDCGKCVFMAGCMSVCTPGLSATRFEYLAIISGTLAPPRDADHLVGRGQPPPERPPRVMV